MPVITTEVETSIQRTFRVEQIAGMFDLPLEQCGRQSFAAEIPALDESWSIGLIVGPSGSGKSTLAKAAFGEHFLSPFSWPTNAGIIDGFASGSIQEITQLLTAVGLGSPPAWIRPYPVLSNGEKFRCDLARNLWTARETPTRLAVIDEFTSMVDRTVAQVASAAVSRAIRTGRLPLRLVAISCHDDIRHWLAPDWVVDLGTGETSWRCLRRPTIQLQVVRCRQSLWRMFARHHYLSGGLSRGSTCYVALWNERPVAFCAVVAQFGLKGHKRISRAVTLPDYQGLGIGARLLERVCEFEAARGFRMSITASHPAIIGFCRRSRRWRAKCVQRSGNKQRRLTEGRIVPTSIGRAVASFEFIPENQS